ncbi:Pancreatic triacylglycerol lipase like protein [Argiope bruennichi]|uniref:Pancreatic triacylglycerol lipase like protein n=1 Tax=Argiope bruennichi TaxID=94029 RepID=A0A8T0EED5_ARGBR|nr:Pancreatic triacylglycerol lipase like protein [Argiope bruennichi]
MKITFNLALVLAVFSIFVIKTDAFLDLFSFGMQLVFDGMRKSSIQKRIPPSNRDDSIQYLLYTPSNRNEPCLIQPNPEQFDRCAFNANYETKFLIHGFIVQLIPGNLINIMKDALLEHDNYNVIVVNWTTYGVMPFRNAFKNSQVVGEKVGEMMTFIQSHAKVSPKTFHCIGHSLAFNLCSIAGRHVHTLGRITGLDPEGMYWGNNLLIKLDPMC